ncbi:MAG: 16S rRNA (guanine(527)-N(7))-methyltransferase RsmG [Bacteroidetes bacterium]|nr:16S rRNA (guanine(527)-N(7))-methyltransferase RsmG [Bacteroidota bacterium]
MEAILKYFPDLTNKQIEQFRQLGSLYPDWNSKINVISRKDIDNLYVHHVLHSLAIAKFIRFQEGTKILDIGTGGGFPGIPLAIIFSEVKFHLIDSTLKKIKVVQAIADSLRLSNIKTEQIRAEEMKGRYEFIVCRAVMDLGKLYGIAKNLIEAPSRNIEPNGVICLKGGDLKEEIANCPAAVEQIGLKDYFEEEFFMNKYLLSIDLLS